MFQKSKTKMQPFNYQWQLFFEQDFKLILPSSISLMLFIDKSVIGDNYNQYTKYESRTCQLSARFMRLYQFMNLFPCASLKSVRAQSKVTIKKTITAS